MNTMRIIATCCLGMLLSAGTANADSLFDESTYRSLASDHRALDVGDNLTVLIVENASATATADTRTAKSGSLAGSVSDTQGLEAAGGLELSEDFRGNGSIQRTGRLLAQITVTVQSVSRNGDLVVQGDQVIEVNNEKQRISLAGRVRPQDIAPNNTVLSTRLSDAHISYIGKGILGEKQRPGILWRFLDWLGIL